jgi:serine/threonine-protein kinase RsbW
MEMEGHAEPDADEVVRARPDGDTAADPDLTPPHTVKVTLPAQPRLIRVARLVASGLANELGFDVDRLDDVRLAVGEACGFAVQIGAKELDVTYALDERSLGVTIDAVLDSEEADPDTEYAALVAQVLTVAGSAHHIDRDHRRLSIGITFSDAS